MKLKSAKGSKIKFPKTKGLGRLNTGKLKFSRMSAGKMNAKPMGAPGMFDKKKKRRKKPKLKGQTINIYVGGSKYRGKPKARYGTRRRGGGIRKVVGWIGRRKHKGKPKGPRGPGYKQRFGKGVKSAQQETKYRVGQYKVAKRGEHHERVDTERKIKEGKGVRHYTVTKEGVEFQE